MGHLQWLFELFEDKHECPFMIWGDRPFTYSWLIEQVRQTSQELTTRNLHPGRVAALRGDYSPGLIAALLALVDGGAIAVPLSPAAAVHGDEFMKIAQAEFSLSFDDGPLPRVERLRHEANHPLLAELSRRGSPGLVLFSSGSAGKSKAALHDFDLLLEKFKQPRRGMITLTFLMIDHIGGINTLFYALANQGTIVVSPNRDPHVVAATIARHNVELLPASPTFLNLLLLSEAYQQHDLSSLQLVTYGTEMMPHRTLSRLVKVLPHTKLQQTYGLSEVGILRSKSEVSDSLWVKVGGEGYETKVQNGTLWIKARSAMLGYLNAPSPFDQDGWLDTGDLVEVQGELVRFLGRRSEVINVGGAKVYPAESEEILMSIPNVRDVTVSGEPHPITGNIVVARFNLDKPELPAAFRRRVREFCRVRMETYKIPARIEIVDRDQFSERFKKMRRNALGPQ